jgi:hypothetical protein
MGRRSEEEAIYKEYGSRITIEEKRLNSMKEFKNHVETLAPEERRLHWHPTSSTIWTAM